VRVNFRPPRAVVVTGAGSGIGRATALELAKDKATVVVTDIDELTARETVDLIRAKGGTAHAHQLDVTSEEAWQALAAQVRDSYGVPDVLVNNAGIVVGGSFLEHSAEDWERQLDVNLFGVINGCRVIGRQMVERGEGGHIVNIASAAAYTPVPTMPAYCVSKAGVKMLSECLRGELGAHGIGVTAICPGFINTNIGAHGVIVGVDDDVVAQGKSALERFQALEARLPIHIADPSEVARAVRAAVRFDLAIVPVRPEAWYGWVMSRVSPAFVRRSIQPFSGDRARQLVGRLPGARNKLPAKQEGAA
jgi:NAD(P)-dependent dehydrogenase (short-subunit alcohol dehydrogenase family)